MKSVLVTGANSGFGFHIALHFARHGYTVFATTRAVTHDGVAQLTEIARKEQLSLTWIELDVTSQEQVDRARDIIAPIGSLDVLVNNAGFGIIGPMEAYSVDHLKTQYETNVFGAARMMYAFLPLLEKSKKATVINISSIAGLIAAPAYSIYSSSKWALEAFTEVLRYELKNTSVRVALVEPGGFDTDFGINAIGLGKAMPKDVPWFSRVKKRREKLIGNYFRKFRNPEKVSRLVYRIAESMHPKLRNVVGFDANAMYFFRKLLPARVWEWIVTRMVG